jgi:hypothetical protein
MVLVSNRTNPQPLTPNKNSPVCSVKAEDGLNLNINNTNEKVKTKEKIRVT